jgi:hypothetical protein
MIGVFRPRKSALSRSESQLVKAVHCTNCVAMRDSSGALAAMGLPYEADMLLVIALGVLPEARGIPSVKRGCTAMPLHRRAIMDLSSKAREALAAFSVVVAWATAADHERDHGRLRAAWLRRRLDPKLPAAMAALGISPGAAPDPRELRQVNEVAHDSMSNFLADYRPFTRDLWLCGLEAVGVADVRATAWVEGLAESLGDSLLLGDALTDIEQDRKSGTPNPAGTDKGAVEVRQALDSAVQKSRLLLSSLREPWAHLARETASFGLAHQLRRRGAQLTTLSTLPASVQ